MEKHTGNQFESPQYSPETPQQLFRKQVENELLRLTYESTDPLTQEIVLKGLEKIDIKKQVDDIQKYQNDLTIRQAMKRLGSLIIVEQNSKFNVNDSIPGLSIQKGDSYLDIHIPPLSETDKSLSAISQSFTMLAEYITYHQLEAEYIIGVTYEKLAKVSRRYGFQVVEIELPEAIQRGVENVFQNFCASSPLDQDMGKILLCYQKAEKFIQKFTP